MKRVFVPGSRHRALQVGRLGSGAQKAWDRRYTGQGGQGGDGGECNESFASYSWLIRGRLGLEPLLRAELQQLQTPKQGSSVILGASTELKAGGAIEPEGLEAEGLVEVLGPWNVLSWILGCRLAQSIWLRVGEPFPCETLQELEEALEELPFDHFLAPNQPLRTAAWERQSRLNGQELLSALQAPIAQRREASGPGGRPCLLRAVLFRNRCSLELLCASRLGFREVHRSAERAEQAERAEPMPRAPTWTLASAVELKESEPKAEREEARQAVDGTFVAALVSQLRLSDGMVVWDPFCGNGQVLLELLSAMLQLPAVKATDRLPCAKLRPWQVEAVQSSTPRRQAASDVTFVGSDWSLEVIQEARKRFLHFCDFYEEELSELKKRSSGHKEGKERPEPNRKPMARLLQGPTILEEPESREETVAPQSSSSKRKKTPKLRTADLEGHGPILSDPDAAAARDSFQDRRAFSSREEGRLGNLLPSNLEVSLNASSFEEIAPFLSGCVILTKIPSERRGLGPTAKAASLFRRFGHLLKAREKFLQGAYVLCDSSSVFKRQTKLPWQSLCRFRSASGSAWQLLHWAPGVARGLPKRAKTSEAFPSGDLQPGRKPGRRWERAASGSSARESRSDSPKPRLGKKSIDFPVKLDVPGGVPVHLYTNDIDEKTEQQLRNLSRAGIAVGYVAAMPDVHLGKGATIGSVFASRDYVCPNAVGVDIGCGMCAVPVSGPLLRQDLSEKDLLAIQSGLRSSIPTGFEYHDRSTSAMEATSKKLMSQHSPTRWLRDTFGSRHTKQLGTLGGGNHFVELVYDEEDRVWMMLHSGSRNIGNVTAQYYDNLAAKQCNGRPEALAYLRIESPEGRQYLTDMTFCQAYAWENRRFMMESFAKVVKKLTRRDAVWDQMVNIHHNYCECEQCRYLDPATKRWKEEELWITRKGATSAKAGQLGIIPGSMGTGSYIVRGKGEADSWQSCSHGAGRSMSRAAAFRNIDPKTFAGHMRDRGIVWDVKFADKVRDEAPMAYKDLNTVMQNQQDLVEVVHHLQPLINMKGW
ncbi:rtcB [Symbiodinium microadriaticum]|nr:rtcB [Symbiodinium microadriaticum]